jgi:hypothetical protein
MTLRAVILVCAALAGIAIWRITPHHSHACVKATAMPVTWAGRC